jgi:hypothetical protein
MHAVIASNCPELILRKPVAGLCGHEAEGLGLLRIPVKWQWGFSQIIVILVQFSATEDKAPRFKPIIFGESPNRPQTRVITDYDLAFLQ